MDWGSSYLWGHAVREKGQSQSSEQPVSVDIATGGHIHFLPLLPCVCEKPFHAGITEGEAGLWRLSSLFHGQSGQNWDRPH